VSNHAGANVLGAAVLFLAVAFACWLTGDFAQDRAKYYPYTILGLTGGLTALWLVRSVWRLRARRGEAGLSETVGGWLILGVTMLYGVAVVTVGYVVPSMVYMAATAYLLRGRRHLLILTCSVLLPLALYYGLSVGFDRPMPF
jgi:hypothetical protein